jgi:hypothetical protein
MHEGREVLWGSLNGEAQLTIAPPVTGMRDERLEVWIGDRGQLLDVKDAEALREALTTAVATIAPAPLGPAGSRAVVGDMSRAAGGERPAATVEPQARQQLAEAVADWLRDHDGDVAYEAGDVLLDLLDLPPTESEIDEVWRYLGIRDAPIRNMAHEAKLACEIVRLERKARRQDRLLARGQ